MKEGAGEDPFADESSTDETTERSESGDAQTTEAAGQEAETRRTRERQSMQIPYKFRRDGVQDGRNRVPLFLQSETKTAEREALRELEERFDSDVTLTDLREALVKAGLEHLDDVEGQLEKWGYGLTFEE
jgi:hypothetical protein